MIMYNLYGDTVYTLSVLQYITRNNAVRMLNDAVYICITMFNEATHLLLSQTVSSSARHTVQIDS